jgi:hypothetical protein
MMAERKHRLWLEMEHTLKHRSVIDSETTQSPKQFHGIQWFHDPLSDTHDLWVLDDRVVTVYQKKNVVCFVVHESGPLCVLGRNMCIVNDCVYQNGVFVGLTKRPVIRTCFLYNINKYMIQNEREFRIVDLWDWNDSDTMVFTNENSPIHFHKHHGIVFYVYNNHLCVAETDSPFRILMERIPKQKYHRIKYLNHQILLQGDCHNVVFSMFPISFTDSTNILTTFE